MHTQLMIYKATIVFKITREHDHKQTAANLSGLLLRCKRGRGVVKK